MPDTGDQHSGAGQVLLSRRQILTGTTYGIGATLLFHHTTTLRGDRPRPRGVDVAPPRGAPRRRDPAPRTRLDASTDAPQGAVRATTVDHDPQRQRAIHRAQLSDHGQPRSVCKTQAGVLVVGMSDDAEPLGWMTQDGSQWVEHTLGSADRGTAEVWGVTGHGRHFVAVGSTIDRTDRHIAESGIVAGVDNRVTFVERRRSPTIWWSSDCTRWAGQTLDDVVGPHAQLIAIGCDGRRLVAVGSVLDTDGVQGARGLVLTSTDGTTWRRADLGSDADLAEGSFTAVAPSDDGWYATSVDMDGAAVWRSADGRTWSLIRESRHAFSGMTLQGIGVDRRRLLAAGTALFDTRPRYFTSRTGGRTWRPVALDVAMLAGPDALVGDLTVISGDVVVVGTHRGAPVLEGGQLHAAH